MNFLANWFQLGPLPANRLEGYYDPNLVILSYFVACLASYVALTIVARLREEKSQQATLYWLLGGAFTMGAGIWSMHFIGMLAFVLPMPMEYEFTWTIASLLMAMIASGFALFLLQKKYDHSPFAVAMGGLLIGLGISSMHYMGMEGMKSHVNIHYLPGLFFLSIFIGIAAAEAALWLALESNKGSRKRQANFKIGSALIMGFAICGMHYMGMFASVFTASSTHSMGGEQAIQAKHLAFFIAGVTALIISLALTVSSYYKKMIDAVQNEKEFLNAMLDNLEDGIIACNEKGNITVLNNAILKNFVLDIANKNINIEELPEYYQLFTCDKKPLPKENYPLQRAFRGEVIQRLPLIIKFDHGEVDVIIDGQPIITKDGKSLGAVIVVHDITELKHTEKLKNEFVSIVSHELRTPLTSIRGSLGLLVSGVLGTFSEKSKKLLDIANNNCERLLLLINDILDIEKIEAGKMEFQLKDTNLNQLIHEAVEANKMYAEKYSISLEIIQQEELLVSVDPGRLMQVLANLLSNACKFSPPNETVTIEIQKKGNKGRVAVIDKGAGIPLEFQQRIFQKFSQADSSDTRGKGGTGLGLNISKSIIEKMGGMLDFISKPNEGTTFYFDLPLLDSSKKHEAIQKIPDSKSTKHLLICEDDQDQADYLKALLETAGFEVDIASTAAEAKEKLHNQCYQAMLLDLILPDQDGIALIRELRLDKRTRNLPIIVLSIIAQTGKTLSSGDAVSVVDWIDKPVDLNHLLKTINHIKPQETSSSPAILHIEDNPDTQHVVGLLLEKHAQLYSACNLQEAKKMLTERDYDLIILDLVLPDGNGVEILPLLAKYKTPVLVFSDMQLSNKYAHYVSQALIKSNSSNEKLLNTITNLI